jgi:hypothetical protein
MEDYLKEVIRLDSSDSVIVKDLYEWNKSYYVSEKSSFKRDKRSF